MQTAILILGTGLFAGIAYWDVRTRRIPNELIVGLLALATLRVALHGDPKSALYTLVAGGTLFVAAFLLFWRGLVGGGDVKLIVATSFLIGYHDVLAFLFVMSLSGGLMAVAILAGDKIRLSRAATTAAENQETKARLTVPYGVAIAVAGIFTLFIRSFVPG
jgi:prepilin peptidase CpaA